MELKEFIQNAEERIADYKKMLEESYKDKVTFPVSDELSNRYKALLRDAKNLEQVWLKEAIKEKTHENEGMNPPFCYLKYN